MSRSVVVSFLQSPVASARLLCHPSACMCPPAYLSSRSTAPEAQCPISQTVRRSCWHRSLYMLDIITNIFVFVRTYMYSVKDYMWNVLWSDAQCCLMLVYVKDSPEAFMIQVSLPNLCSSMVYITAQK